MHNQVIDRAGQVRTGEELDLRHLHPWLLKHIQPLQQCAASQLPLVTQYSGGASNWTYCLTYTLENATSCEVILRRAPAGTKAKGAHDMGREYRLQAALKPVYDYVPQMYGYCDDNSIIGTDFYVMEKLHGIIPRKNMPKGLNMTAADTRQLCLNALDSLIKLHQVDYQKAGLSHLAKGEGYIQRQISGWSERYRKAKTWNVPSGKYVMRWLQANMPKDENICLTHNDFRFDNLVLNSHMPTEIIGVLDWELATLGDPLMDLGNALAYWVQADDDRIAKGTRRQPSHLEGMLTRREVIDYYQSNTAIKLDNFAFYEVYGLFRLAAIAQQIYYRYHHKQTDNPAFKYIWFYVHYLLWQCRKAIKGQRLMTCIYLIRHGQASFGLANYDCLSSLGEQQANLLGKHFSQRNIQFDGVVRGAMQRHAQTAEHCLLGLAKNTPAAQIDASWNEYDHQDILAQLDSLYATPKGVKSWLMAQPNPQLALESLVRKAFTRWIESQHDSDYQESWSAYQLRIQLALEQLISQNKQAKHLAVFTSGGPIALICQMLLGVPAHKLMDLNWTLVNAGVSKIIVSRKGPVLSSMNEHTAFDNQHPTLISYK